MSGSSRPRATYQNVLNAPPHLVAEIVDGELRLSPRPGGPHTLAASRLGYILGPAFDLGAGGPGGWIVLYEPELHFDPDVLVPDLAGWRRERMSCVTRDAYFVLAPDWVCEVLSPSTAVNDRLEKLPIYARAGVRYAWFVDPIQRTLEVLRVRDAGDGWITTATHHDDARVRAEPFEGVELDLAVLWSAIAPRPPVGTYASELTSTYSVR